MNRRRSRRRARRGAWLINGQRTAVLAVLVLASGLGLVAVGGILAAWSRIQESAQVADIFNDVAEIPPERLATVTWLADGKTRRPMEPETRRDLTLAWIRAWEARSLYQSTGNANAIEAAFSGPALDAIRQVEHGPRVEPIDHRLQLVRYSADGLLVALKVEPSRVMRELTTGGRSRWIESEERYDAVLQLEDGNWRIVQLVRRGADLADRAVAATEGEESVSATAVSAPDRSRPPDPEH